MQKQQAKVNYHKQQRNERFYNEKMVVCQSRGIALDQLVDVLHEKGILPHLSAIQKIKYGVMYALVVEHPEIRKDLVLNGLDVDCIHLTFTYHKTDFLKVYISNIPCGVSTLDINRVFGFFGSIKEARMIRKRFHNVQLNTGDWLVTFQKLTKSIPSYINVRGWWAYVKYDRQVQTCRNCHQGGHIFANCPTRNGKGTKPDEKPRNEDDRRTSETENMDLQEMPSPNESDLTEEETRSTPSMQEENPDLYKPPPEEPVHHDAYQEIMENLGPLGNRFLAHVTVEDCQVLTSVENEAQQNEANSRKQSQAWADSIEESSESSTAGSEKPQEEFKQNEQKTKVKIQVRPKTYCPACRVDSHSEEQCGKVTHMRQPNKIILGRRDSKPG